MHEEITACIRCGSTTFFVHEATVWDAEIHESGILLAHRPSSEIECVACQECADEYDPTLFVGVDFNT
jgi:hypothetical protein